jgi:uncharacterized tellurite resistance protein B-like protein
MILRALKSLLDRQLTERAGANRGHALELAAAALLLEVTRADDDYHPGEEAAVIAAVRSAYSLSEVELETVVNSAAESIADAVSLHEFTSVLNERLDFGERCALIEDLWRVAYADGRVDKYEDYTVRKIAELLYVPHAQFIRAKLRAAGES